MENNKVNVRIYGQEYTIAGEKDEESIRKIAAHVNNKMKELGKSFSLSGQGTIAVLAAINIADEYFDAVISVDSYHYYGNNNMFFSEKIRPILKKTGYLRQLFPV